MYSGIEWYYKVTFSKENLGAVLMILGLYTSGIVFMS